MDALIKLAESYVQMFNELEDENERLKEEIVELKNELKQLQARKLMDRYDIRDGIQNIIFRD